MDSSFFGLGRATDLITSGDWTVPREGSTSVLSNNDVGADSASGLGDLLFQSPFSTLLLLLCSGLFATRDLLRVLKNAHGGWEKRVGDTPPCQRQMGT